MKKFGVMGANTLLKKIGDTMDLEISYEAILEVPIDSTKIRIKDTFGILPGTKFLINLESIEATNSDFDWLYLKQPTTEYHPEGSMVTTNLVCDVVPVTKTKNLSRDELEYIKRFRVSKDIPISHGSLARFQGRNYFIVGVDISDLSYSIKLREANAAITIQHEVKGPYNGFGYEYNWEDKYSEIPAYFNHMSSEMRMEVGAGYLPKTDQSIVIQNRYQVDIHQRLVSSYGIGYKVVGIDRHLVRNMTTLIVDYDLDRKN